MIPLVQCSTASTYWSDEILKTLPSVSDFKDLSIDATAKHDSLNRNIKSAITIYNWRYQKHVETHYKWDKLEGHKIITR